MTDTTRRTVLAAISAMGAASALPAFVPSFGTLLVPAPEPFRLERIVDALERIWQAGYMPELIASFRAVDEQVFTDVADALEGSLRRGEMPEVIAGLRARSASVS